MNNDVKKQITIAGDKEKTASSAIKGLIDLRFSDFILLKETNKGTKYKKAEIIKAGKKTKRLEKEGKWHTYKKANGIIAE